MTAIQTQLITMMTAIEERKQENGKVKFSVALYNDGVTMRLYLRSDTDANLNQDLWTMKFISPTYDFGNTLLRSEILDIMKALKELGNVHIRELNSR